MEQGRIDPSRAVLADEQLLEDEELWRDEDNPTYQTASRLFADGMSRHDVIHRLAGTPAPTVGSSVIR